jgi:hypothetical protein
MHVSSTQLGSLCCSVHVTRPAPALVVLESESSPLDDAKARKAISPSVPHAVRPSCLCVGHCALLSASGTRKMTSPGRWRRRTQHRVLLGQAVRDADDVKRYGANRLCLMQGGPTGKMVVLVSTLKNQINGGLGEIQHFLTHAIVPLSVVSGHG